MMTHAIVFRQANVPALEQVALPPLEADDLLVRIAYSGVSIGTEQSIFSGIRTHNGTFPLVGGYMAAGTIEAAGESVSGFAVGDRVVTTGARFAPESGITSVWGCHSSLQVVKGGNCMPIPAGVDLREAAMYVMPGVGLNAVNMAQVALTDTVLIQGQGLIGQLCGQWCRNRGARVITLEPDPTRRELCRRLVTDHALDPAADDLPEQVASLTGGRGPDVVIEATASARLISSATRFLRSGSKMIFLSWYPEDISITFGHFHNHQVTAYFPTGSGGHPATRATLQALAAGSINLADNITDDVSFDHAVEGYQRIIAGDRSIMGMVVDWRNA